MTGEMMLPPSGCPIKELSVEVLLRITFWLKTPDLCNMRLTCRAFEDMLLNSFAQEFIERKQFMISPSSLQALIDLSKSRLAVHLRRLQFGTDMLELNPHWYNSTGNAEGMRLVQAQRACIRDGTHRRLLTEAFRNLSKCGPANGVNGLRKDFEIVVRDFNSRRRTRDAGPGRYDYAEWNSQGTKTALDLGVQVRNRPAHSHTEAWTAGTTTTDIFRYLLVALGDAGVQPSGLEVMTRADDMLLNDAFLVNSQLEPGISTVLEGLQKLHLSTAKKGPEQQFDPDTLTLDNTVNVLLNDLPDFLTHCSSLRDFRLNQAGLFNKWSETFLIWLSKPASSIPELVPQGWPSPIRMGSLASLSIGRTVTRPSILQRIISKFAPTLRSIELWRVTLATRCELNSIDDCPDAEAWKKFLPGLITIEGLDLQHIMLGNVAECFYSGNHLHFDGSVNRRMHFNGTPTYEYRGTEWKYAIQDIIKCIGPHDDLETYKRMLRHSEDSDSEDDDGDANMDEVLFEQMMLDQFSEPADPIEHEMMVGEMMLGADGFW